MDNYHDQQATTAPAAQAREDLREGMAYRGVPPVRCGRRSSRIMRPRMISDAACSSGCRVLKRLSGSMNAAAADPAGYTRHRSGPMPALSLRGA